MTVMGLSTVQACLVSILVNGIYHASAQLRRRFAIQSHDEEAHEALHHAEGPLLSSSAGTPSVSAALPLDLVNGDKCIEGGRR